MTYKAKWRFIDRDGHTVNAGEVVTGPGPYIEDLYKRGIIAKTNDRKKEPDENKAADLSAVEHKEEPKRRGRPAKEVK